MKILMATMQLDIGGAETHIVELAKQLRKQGHDITSERVPVENRFGEKCYIKRYMVRCEANGRC